MTLLEQYASLTERRKEAFARCLRSSGPFALVPTNRGGVALKYANQDVDSDISLEELRSLRDLITDFLVDVAGERA